MLAQDNKAESDKDGDSHQAKEHNGYNKHGKHVSESVISMLSQLMVKSNSVRIQKLLTSRPGIAYHPESLGHPNNLPSYQSHPIWKSNGHVTQRDNQGQFITQCRSQADNYGDQWVSSNDHPYWGKSERHQWNKTNNQWYGGGRLNITPWVSGNDKHANYGYSKPSGKDSTYLAVQHRQADFGYYTVPFDGQVGRFSSQAIANYHQDQPKGYRSYQS